MIGDMDKSLVVQTLVSADITTNWKANLSKSVGICLAIAISTSVYRYKTISEETTDEYKNTIKKCSW